LTSNGRSILWALGATPQYIYVTGVFDCLLYVPVLDNSHQVVDLYVDKMICSYLTVDKLTLNTVSSISKVTCILNTVIFTPIARQRVGEKIPRRQILGKHSVARLRRNRRGCVFYIVRAEHW
jgi:hypothetical protein